MTLLESGLEKCGISKAEKEVIAPKMETYIKELILFNSAYNLTNTSDHDELVTNHILDSLSTYKTISGLVEKADASFIAADIGSGGGLPGIPLAAAFPQVKFRLVERMAKRCAFLENCAAILGLKNVEIINSEAEKIPDNSFNLVVFRAFRPLDQKMTKTLLRITKKDGILAAYKAKEESIKEEMEGIKDLAGNYQIEKLYVPGLEDKERNLVLITKS
ncbi:MAG: 16S rRNA (guanine(527)-N(7))-methyltransferase RsmG [Treponema sp.]|nr:16S rRNA (guanine(527)-N(7))-methyltransferase RsmG [Treponema sp.]